MSDKLSATFLLTVFSTTTFLTTMPANSQEGARQLEEVIVTAQRREESLQKIPVAVTAVSSEDMAAAQVDSITNIQQLSPSIKFDVTNSAANSANILIRGIGTVGNSRAFEGAVGVFVDGVYRTRAGQAMQNWLDIESLQILRGPQGTLFGKNTSAGALILQSTAPSLQSVEGDYEVTIGDYDKQLIRSAVNLPLGDNAAFRVAGLWGQQEGYIENPYGDSYNDRNPRAIKAQFLMEPSDVFSIHVIADWAEEENNCCYGQIDVVDGPFQSFINDVLIPDRGLQPPSSNFDDYEQVLSNDTDQTIEDKGVVVKMEWELPSGSTLSSVTASRDWSISQWGMDADFTGANILTINESLSTELLSQEFTLTGVINDLGPFESTDYVIGLYYADEEIDADHQLLWGDQAQPFFDVLIGAPGVVDASEGIWSDVDMPATSKSYAAFMHWNLDLNEKLGFTVGLRYSKDEKEGAMIRPFFTGLPNTPFRVLGVQPGPEYSDDFDDQAVSGSLAVRYQFNENLMGYASYSRGYKSGGVNIDNTGAGSINDNPNEPTCGIATPVKPAGDCIPNDPTYKSEFVDGYELGLKAEYLGGMARTNVALFYNEMTDLQIAQFIGTRFTIDNAPEATVYGAEIENNFLLSDVLTLTFDLTYLPEARFGDDSSLLNLADREFAHAPEFAGNFALSMAQPVSNDLTLVGRFGVMSSTELYTNTSNDFQRDAETEINTNIGLRSESGGWSLMAWCQNCTDQRYVSQHFNSPLQGPDANGYVVPPRTYGLTWRGSF